MPLFTLFQDPIVTVSASSMFNPWGVDLTDVGRLQPPRPVPQME